MLSLQQSASTSSWNQNFLPLSKKWVAQADNAPGPSKKPTLFDTQVAVSSSSTNNTDTDNEGKNLAEPFDLHTHILLEFF